MEMKAVGFTASASCECLRLLSSGLMYWFEIWPFVESQLSTFDESFRKYELMSFREAIFFLSGPILGIFDTVMFILLQ